MEKALNNPPLSQTAILVVDDDPIQCDELATYLRKKGHFVFTAYDGFSALTMIKNLKPAVVLLDINMPNMSGTKISRVATNLDFRTTIVLMSGFPNCIYEANHQECGAFAVLDKPLPLRNLDRFLSSLTGNGRQ